MKRELPINQTITHWWIERGSQDGAWEAQLGSPPADCLLWLLITTATGFTCTELLNELGLVSLQGCSHYSNQGLCVSNPWGLRMNVWVGAFVLVLSKIMRCVHLYVGLTSGREKATSWWLGGSGADQKCKSTYSWWLGACFGVPD